MILDFFRNCICVLKLPFLASLLLNFSTICSHMLSKFINKVAQKISIFSRKANFQRSLLKYALFLLLLLPLPSCLRARYTPQPVCAPQEWRLDTNEGSTLCNFRWWEQFEDPMLNDLILTAIENNQDLKVAIYRVKEFYAQLGVVGSYLYPTINGVADAQNIKASLRSDIPIPPGVKRVNNNFDMSFNLNWELDIWGRIYNASYASYADWLGQVEARRGVVLMVVTSVATTYINLRALDAQLLISEETLKSRLRSLEIAKTRFDLGETSFLEVTQAAVEVEDAKIAVIELEREIPQKENLLSILIGENPHDIERGVDINNFSYPVTIPSGLPSDLLTRRPDVVQSEDRLIAANARVWESYASYFPKISLTDIYGNQSDQLSELLKAPAQMWFYGINAVQPIFNACRTYYEVEQAKAIRNEALYGYRQVVLNALLEVNNALVKTKMNRELVLERERQVKVLREYFSLANLRYLEGEVDYLNVLDAERKLFSAQLMQIQAQADNFNSVVLLYGSLGGGWVMDADDISQAGMEL
jgi:outer membrane protein, multidrug efflux system